MGNLIGTELSVEDYRVGICREGRKAEMKSSWEGKSEREKQRR